MKPPIQELGAFALLIGDRKDEQIRTDRELDMTERKPLILDMQQRYKQNFDYYCKTPHIQRFFKALDKIIDNYDIKL